MGKPSSGGTSSVKGTKGNDKFQIAERSKLATTSYDGLGGSDTLELSWLDQGIAKGIAPTATGEGVSIMLLSDSLSALSVTSGFRGIYWSQDSWTQEPGVVRNTLKNIENITGTSGRDILFANGGTDNLLYGAAGNDSLSTTGLGNDRLIGGAGADWIRGAAGDILVGSEWNRVTLPTTAPLAGDGAKDTFINGGTILDFELGIDRLMIDYSGLNPSAIQWVDTSSGANVQATLRIGGGDVFVLAGVSATAAASVIKLGQQPGNTNGGVLRGGEGDDVFRGFEFPDTFVIEANGGDDAIIDFDRAEDKLLLQGLSAPASTDWIDRTINGQSAIEWDYGPGSVTILGLTSADAGLIQFA